jgi:hypothetical protein
METGDVLVGEDGSSVVVCAIAGSATVGNATTSGGDPDVVVAEGHPWASAGEPSVVRVRLGGTLAGHDAVARATGPYSLSFQQPMYSEDADGYARCSSRTSSSGCSITNCGGSPRNCSVHAATS